MESYSVGLYSSCEIDRHGEVNSIQNCMIEFGSDLWQSCTLPEDSGVIHQ